MRIAIVGIGKIARDQHVPAIRTSPDFTLVATASLAGTVDAIPAFPTLDALLHHGPEIDAVAVCTPPQVRRQQAALALQAGKHVLLEKPPGPTVAELRSLIDVAHVANRTLFAAWHSRLGAAVEPARAFLAVNRPSRFTITWKEDVRVWHPDQTWLWQPGGLGVFDPGINALSILTHILPTSVFLTDATLFIPSNQDTPIAAELRLSDGAGSEGVASFDFRQTGQPRWDIETHTEGGTVRLERGGAEMSVGGVMRAHGPKAEYPALYRRFASLAASNESDVDLDPLVLVADAFLLGRRVVVEAFEP